MEKFSVIIPHKNIPLLLTRCLASIPTSDDIEVIVVDDNSDPGIVDFNNFPGNNRTNVKTIFNKDGKGAGAARNIGLKESTGKWLVFADADDFFHDDAFDNFKEFVKSNKDLYVFDTDSVMSDTLEHVENREDIVCIYKAKNDENILRFLHHCVWGKIFKREVFENNNFCFQEVAASNDAYFAACYGVYAKDVEFLDYVGYCCTVRRGSICTRLSKENISARIKVAYDVNNLYRKHGVSTKYWMNLLGPLFNMYRIDKMEFVQQYLKYLGNTPFVRLVQDSKESGQRFVKRLIGNGNDKEVKKIQTVQK